MATTEGIVVHRGEQAMTVDEACTLLDARAEAYAAAHDRRQTEHQVAYRSLRSQAEILRSYVADNPSRGSYGEFWWERPK